MRSLPLCGANSLITKLKLTVIEEAIERGRVQGDASARQALNQHFETELARARRLMDELIAAGPKLRRHAEEDMVRLAVAIARRVLHREITVDGNVLLGLVKAAFSRIDQREIVQIRTDATLMGVLEPVIQDLDWDAGSRCRGRCPAAWFVDLRNISRSIGRLG